MRTFLRTFIFSLTRPSYYQDILKARPRFSIKYYILLTLILTTATSVAGIINYAPALKSDFTQVAQEIVQNFPPDLIIEIKPTGIAANKPFPLVAQTPTAFIKNQPASLPKNLLIIDPHGKVGMLEEYDALALVNNSYLIVSDGESVQTAPLKDLPDLRVDSDFMEQLASVARFIANNAFWLTGLAFEAVGLVDFFVVKLVYLLFFAFVLRLFHRTLFGTFAQAVKVSIHSFTLPVLISTTLGIAGVNITLPGWFVILHIIFVLYILSKLEESPIQLSKRTNKP